MIKIWVEYTWGWQWNLNSMMYIYIWEHCSKPSIPLYKDYYNWVSTSQEINTTRAISKKCYFIYPSVTFELKDCNTLCTSIEWIPNSPKYHTQKKKQKPWGISSSGFQLLHGNLKLKAFPCPSSTIRKFIIPQHSYNIIQSQIALEFHHRNKSRRGQD